MGYKLKPTKSVVSPYDGSSITTAYGIIDFVGIDKKRQMAHVDLVIYVNRAARVNNLKPMDSYGLDVSGADFVTYFGPNLTTTIWTQAQTYLIAKGAPNTSFVVGDWMIEPLDSGGEP